VLIDLPGNGAYPIFAQVERKRARTEIVLAASGAPVSRLAAEAEENAPPVDLSLEHRLEAVTPWRRARAVTHRVILAGAMAPYAWSLNGEYWPNVTPLMIATGQRVAIEMLNHTMTARPIIFHGHAFQMRHEPACCRSMLRICRPPDKESDLRSSQRSRCRSAATSRGAPLIVIRGVRCLCSCGCAACDRPAARRWLQPHALTASAS
jgi:FtsP/CotA-like multicopper oxidase with cupredoxin domain